MLDSLPIRTSDYLHVLGAILKLHNPKHSLKHKGVSRKTMLDRQRFLSRFFTELRKEAGFADADPRRLNTRQVEAMVERWLQRDLSTATIHNYVCFLRTYCSWIGRPGMVRKVEDYVGAESPHAKRKQVATFDHSWSARQVDFEATLAQVARMDRWVGLQLELCQRFGMRPKEARHFRPHKAVLSRERANPADVAAFPEHETFVRIEHGTKGGRPRDVPLANNAQRELLDRVTAVVASGCFVGQPGLTADQSRRRFYYVLECCGITHAKLGVVAHGLRHEHANDAFEADAGGPSPVRGGAVDPPRDTQARERVARRLGHNRPRVARCYLGMLATRRAAKP